MLARLTDLCDIQYGYAFDSAQFSETEGIPLVRIRDVVRGFSETYTTEAFPEEYRVHEGDILIGMDGEFNIARWHGGTAALNQRVCRLIPREVNAEYIFHFMPSALKAIEDKTPFVTVKHLTAKELNKVMVPIPTLDEQIRIGTILNKVREIIDARQRQLRAVDTLIKARFVEMFGDITETVPLSFYIESLTAGKSLAGEEECQYKVLKTGAATYDYFDPLQVKNLPIDYLPLPEHQIHDGDVIISRMNTTELVGAAAYVWKAPEHTYLPDRLWRAELTDKANPIFVWQAIVQPTTKSAIRRIAGGTSGSMKNISKIGLLSLRVKKVELAQQDQFAAFVSQVDKSKVAVQAALNKDQLLFDSLMQQYFG